MSRKKKMVIWLSLAVIIAGAACIYAYIFLFHSANGQLRNDQVRIGSAVFDAEIASTTTQQARGLSFRDSLAEGHGMLFLFPSPGILHFWMKDMNFPIDMIWIAGGKVAGFAENAAPEPGVALWNLTIYNSPDGTDKVLEVNAGAVAKENIKVGDTVQIGPGVI
jgi:uncharacterized membrane protein (UPF0127 family)